MKVLIILLFLTVSIVSKISLVSPVYQNASFEGRGWYNEILIPKREYYRTTNLLNKWGSYGPTHDPPRSALLNLCSWSDSWNVTAWRFYKIEQSEWENGSFCEKYFCDFMSNSSNWHREVDVTIQLEHTTIITVCLRCNLGQEAFLDKIQSGSCPLYE